MTRAAAPSSPDSAWIALIAAIAGVYFWSIAPLFLVHHDLGWQLAAGDLIRAAHEIPHNVVWSFTGGDQQWYNFSWGWDVGASLLYQWGGFTVLVIATWLAACLIAALLARLCFAAGARPLPVCIAAVFALIVFPAYAPIDIFLAVAPQVVSLIFSLTFYLILLSARRLWLLPLLMLAWANLHGGFPAGLVVIAVFALGALLLREYRRLQNLIVIGALTFAATLLNPVGWKIYIGILRGTHHFICATITEWMPFLKVASWPASLPACLYILLFIALELRPARVPVAMRALSWLWLALGLHTLRYLSLFFLFSAPHVAAALSEKFPRLRTKIPAAALWIPTALLFAAAPYFYYQRFPEPPGFMPRFYPQAEIAYIEKNRPQAHLLNHWNYGGFLIFTGRGHPEVFVDGRAATAYPDELLADYMTLFEPRPEWQRVLSKYHIDTVLWPNVVPEQWQFFIGNPHWKLIYSGPVANVFAKVK